MYWETTEEKEGSITGNRKKLKMHSSKYKYRKLMMTAQQNFCQAYI
jgi:hypothetical protein